jgi:hypothetical protein
MEVLHPELRRVMSALPLAQESRNLLFATMMVEKGKSPYSALRLIWLLDNLRERTIPSLILLQKTEWLENLLTLIRQGQKEWVRRVCYIVYEGNLPRENHAAPFPEGMIRDLLKWVNAEKAEKVREILWAILLRKEIGLASFAETDDVASGLCEKDPITRNNVIRFLFDHFSPEMVLDSLFQYSMASGKKVPGVVFKRYVGLLKDQGDLPEKKSILERILSSAKLDDREMDQIFSDYINSLNRFDLIRLLSLSEGCQPRFADLKRKRRQMAFAFDEGRIVPSSHEGFRARITAMMSFGRKPGKRQV